MGFWKKLGSIALKAAPIAAAFIPGVGPLASMAINAGTSALSKKLAGGSWKDSLISGGIGAATGYGAGKALGAIKGLGPSNPASYVKNAVSSVENKALGKTSGGIGSSLGRVATSALGGGNQQGGVPGATPPYVDDGRNGWQEQLGGVLGQIGNTVANRRINTPQNPNIMYNGAMSRAASGVMPQGGYSYDEDPSNQLNQNTPNLAQSIFQGRQEALKRRPQYAY